MSHTVWSAAPSHFYCLDDTQWSEASTGGGGFKRAISCGREPLWGVRLWLGLPDLSQAGVLNFTFFREWSRFKMVFWKLHLIFFSHQSLEWKFRTMFTTYTGAGSGWCIFVSSYCPTLPAIKSVSKMVFFLFIDWFLLMCGPWRRQTPWQV